MDGGRCQKKALQTFKANKICSPLFQLKDQRTEVLCKELAGSETSGWAKMNNHTLIESLTKDTVIGKVQNQEDEVQNERLTFLEEVGWRMKKANETAASNFHPRETHKKL